MSGGGGGSGRELFFLARAVLLFSRGLSCGGVVFFSVSWGGRKLWPRVRGLKPPVSTAR